MIIGANCNDVKEESKNKKILELIFSDFKENITKYASRISFFCEEGHRYIEKD